MLFSLLGLKDREIKNSGKWIISLFLRGRRLLIDGLILAPAPAKGVIEGYARPELYV